MAHIVISEFMDCPAINWLRDRFSVYHDASLVEDRDRLLALGLEAEGIIVRNRTQVDARLLAAYPTLRAVGRLGVGLDNIDIAACEAAGVAVLPATGGNTISVAEYVVTAVMVLRRGAWMGSADVLSGAWPRERMMGFEVSGAILGLIGFGAIAQATAVCARALGMTVIAHDPFVPADDPAWDGVERCTELATLLAGADAVSLHVPLTDGTRGLIDTAALEAMKPGAILVNTARGEVVDESALVEALDHGKLAGAALDVFAAEPLPAGSALAEARNLIATPHIAGVTHESNSRISWITAKNVARVLERGA